MSNIIQKAVVITALETTEYTINKQPGSVAEINAVLSTIPSSKGLAAYSTPDNNKALFSWAGVGGATLWIYIDGVGFEAGGVATPGLTPMGARSTSVSYKINQLVIENGSTYRSKQSNNLNKPVTDSLWWEVFSGRGTALFPTTAALAASGTSSISVSTLTMPSGYSPIVGDMIVSTHSTSVSIHHTITAISGSTLTTTFRYNSVGTPGAEGLSEYPTSAVLASSGNSTVAVSSITVPSGRTLKIGDLLISTNASSSAIKHRVTDISGGNATTTFVVNSKGATGPTGPAGTPAGLYSGLTALAGERVQYYTIPDYSLSEGGTNNGYVVMFKLKQTSQLGHFVDLLITGISEDGGIDPERWTCQHNSNVNCRVDLILNTVSNVLVIAVTTKYLVNDVANYNYAAYKETTNGGALTALNVNLTITPPSLGTYVTFKAINLPRTVQARMSGGVSTNSELYYTSIPTDGPPKEVYIEIVQWSVSATSTPTLGYVSIMINSGVLSVKGAKKVGEGITNMKVCIIDGNLGIRFNTSMSGRYRQVRAYEMTAPIGLHADAVTSVIVKSGTSGETGTVDVTFADL